MVCQNCKTAIAARRYAFGVAPTRIAVLCDSCRDALNGIGFGLREERRAAERDNRPEWLRRLTPKVMDHGTVA